MARGEVLELAASIGYFLVPQAGLNLQPQNPARAKKSHPQAEHQRGHQRDEKPRLEAKQQRNHLIVPGSQLLFVDGGDPVGDREHILPARENLFIALSLGGGSVDSMVLGGFALAFSRLIDNSVVVLENIYRHLELGEEPAVAAEKSGREVALPVLAATLTTVVVFFLVIQRREIECVGCLSGAGRVSRQLLSHSIR